MSSGEKKTKMKLAHHVEDIEAILKRREAIGSSLTIAQRSFLEDVAFRDLLWYRYGYHAHRDGDALPAGMDHQQRQTKVAVIERLRGELSDLALLAETSAPNLEEVRRSVAKGGHKRFHPWISRLDVLEALDLEDLCKVVGFAVEVFGEEYATALTHSIESYKRSKNKKS